EDTGAPPTPVKLPSYMLKSYTTRFSNNQAERSCFLLYDSAHYHLESTTQHMGTFELESKIFEGSLGPQDVAKLKSLLNAPEWKDLPYNEPPVGMAIHEGEVAFFTIRRDDKAQKLAMWHFTGQGKSVLSGKSPTISELHTDLLNQYDS